MTAEPVVDAARPGRRRQGPTASILIIDDEPAVGLSLRRTLERAGHTVTVTTSGTEGLETFKRAQHEVVITDILMPKLHGIDLIRSVRQLAPRTCVIAISGGGNFGRLRYEPEALTTSAYLIAAREAGADEVLTKPFERDELLASITRVLEQRRGKAPS
ncbi:MAG: response regulator [Sinobacteraceae bacterium]|nr:response regulator [Nevskiaceae bacterium]